jgi:hypothetical protein
MTIKTAAIVLVHAFVGWALCAATMGVGLAATTMQTALIVHAIGAPIYFAGVSTAYFRRFNFTRPLPTAFLFVGFTMFVDFFVVALVINRSLAMFESLLGTWIPFALIFGSTLVTGGLVSTRRNRAKGPASKGE